MGYVYLLCVALMFSFGGTCVKLISPYFNASWITFFRFFIGVVWLLILKCILRQPFQKNLKQALLSCWKWILFGAFIKLMSYLTENYALSHGLSYGDIVTQPSQTLFLTLVSVLCFKEKLSPRKGFCIFLCIGGVLCISLNGRPLDVFFKENLLFTGLFILSGICAGCHVLSQKMVAGRLDIIDSNLAIFTLSGLFSLIPAAEPVFTGKIAFIRPDLACILAILAFGFITGMGFYLNAKAIPLVPFYMVPVIQSMMAVFAILWGVFFFHETVTGWIIGGTAAFMIGVIGLQMKNN